jgi:hypothetical protein
MEQSTSVVIDTSYSEIVYIVSSNGLYSHLRSVIAGISSKIKTS